MIKRTILKNAVLDRIANYVDTRQNKQTDMSRTLAL